MEILRAQFPVQEADFDNLYGAYQFDDLALEGNGDLAIIDRGDDLCDFAIQIFPEIFAVADFQDFIPQDEQLLDRLLSVSTFVFFIALE